MPLFPRKIYPALLEHLKSPNLTVIIGLRRTGKTTTLKYLMSQISSDNKLYIDFERLDNRDLFSFKNYDTIANNLEQLGLSLNKKSNRAYLFLDDIQLVRNISGALQYLTNHYGIKFIVTGSSSYYFETLFSGALSKRKKIFELTTLDFAEFLDFKQIPHKDDYNSSKLFSKKFNEIEYERLRGYYEEYISFGAFPEVALVSKAEAKRDIIFDILNSYIRIDVKTLADFRNPDNIEKLLKMLAQRVGEKLDYSKLSKLSGMSRETIKNYIDFFEASYLISRVPVLATPNNANREIIKAQKFYFSDNGFLSVLADSSNQSKFENAIFTQLRDLGTLKYYQLKNGAKIDFILKSKTQTIALEVKETPLKQEGAKLEKLASFAKIKNSRLIGRLAVANFKNYIWGGEIR